MRAYLEEAIALITMALVIACIYVWSIVISEKIVRDRAEAHSVEERLVRPAASPPAARPNQPAQQR